MNYYECLGIPKTATETDIKKAYRTLSLKHHPDRGGDSEKFKELSEAYETLSDPYKRKQYDMQQMVGGAAAGRWGRGGGGGGGGINIEELFQNLFQQTGLGGGIRGSFGDSEEENIFTFADLGPGIHIFQSSMSGAPPSNIAEHFAGHPFFGNFVKPQSIHVTVSIELEQVLTGCVVPVNYERFVIREDNRRFTEQKRMEIAVHQGVDDGEIITVPDVGNVVNGINGDIKIKVEIAPHAIYKRDGLNILYEKVINLHEALCGFQFDIPLLNHRTITIKNVNKPVKIIYPDMQQVCAGYGLQKGNTVGALIIQFKLQFPVSMEEGLRQQLSPLLMAVCDPSSVAAAAASTKSLS